jgi:threonine/homoserine/homoserine lactone efflux protein
LVLVVLLLVIGLTLLAVFTVSMSQGRVRVLRSVASHSMPSP